MKRNLNKILRDIKEKDNPPVIAICDDCGWSGKTSECETYWEQDSWETPGYEVAICPKCNEENVIFYNETNQKTKT